MILLSWNELIRRLFAFQWRQISLINQSKFNIKQQSWNFLLEVRGLSVRTALMRHDYHVFWCQTENVLEDWEQIISRHRIVIIMKIILFGIRSLSARWEYFLMSLWYLLSELTEHFPVISRLGMICALSQCWLVLLKGYKFSPGSLPVHIPLNTHDGTIRLHSPGYTLDCTELTESFFLLRKKKELLRLHRWNKYQVEESHDMTVSV